MSGSDRRVKARPLAHLQTFRVCVMHQLRKRVHVLAIRLPLDTSSAASSLVGASGEPEGLDMSSPAQLVQDAYPKTLRCASGLDFTRLSLPLTPQAFTHCALHYIHSFGHASARGSPTLDRVGRPMCRLGSILSQL